jgi:hypothetical protein
MSEKVEMSESEKKKEDWMNSKWRPMMGWMYMVVCMMDFIGFPVLWSLLQAMSKGAVNLQWQPLTLQGAGLFHIAMGAVLGLAAYGRTQEKLNGANNGGIQLPSTGTSYTPPSAVTAPAPSFGNTPLGGNSASSFTPAPSWGTTPTAPATGGFNSSSGFGATASPAVTASGKKIVPDFEQPVI